MATFLETATRIVTDLRRGNLLADAKIAINEAIEEAAQERFYFNEMHTSFMTVPGTEYYSDLGLVELDAVWYTDAGSVKYGVDIESQLDANDLSVGTVAGGALQSISRYGGQLRLYPVPSTVVTVYLDGYGKLAPSPLVADADTNAWLTEGLQFIRNLAKRNLLRDVIRDYGEARVAEGVAEDYKSKLLEKTALKSATGRIRSTQF